ncbi:MAG: hypothetical protein WKF86_11390, partial [Acidimicrobiales bacterium]
WSGTLPLLRLRERVAAEPATPLRARTAEAIAAASTSCSTSSTTLPTESTSTNFHLSYATIGGGLTPTDYLSALETSRSTQVTSFGWAAPPTFTRPTPIGTRYTVRADALSGGLYGFVSTIGTGAGFFGDNPNTPWNEGDSFATCMVLNRDFTPFPGTALQALRATAAHEFNHSIQFGYGALTGGNVPDDALVEAASTWMEDEVFDTANDNYTYLWPDFRESLGDYDANPADQYGLWLMLRGLTERFGTGVAGGGEQVMQDFWEATSRNTHNNLSALAFGLTNKGVSLADAYHDFAIAAGFMKTCGGGYGLPHCFEEAGAYLNQVGAMPPTNGSIFTPGGSFTSTVEDDYGLAWVSLPAGSTYSVTLDNPSGGQLRGTVVCDTGTGLRRTALPALVGGGESTTLSSLSSVGCSRTLAVITNQQQAADNPDESPKRTFTLRTSLVTAPPQPAAGYRLVARDGGIFSYGPRTFRGSTGGIALSQPIVGGATNPDGLDGYWIVAADGGVFAFNVGFFGSLGGQALSAPAVGIEATPTGRGYWIVLADGTVRGFGDAGRFGDLAGITLARAVISISATPSGQGYWLVSADGGVFSFGDAAFFGSTGGIRLNAPVVDLAPAPNGGGYHLVASDGGVFSFGSAQFQGSTGNVRLNAPVVSLLPSTSGNGYWMAASDGGVFNFGVPFLGSVGGQRLDAPVLDIIA